MECKILSGMRKLAKEEKETRYAAEPRGFVQPNLPPKPEMPVGRTFAQ
jgi:hypothetical protein